MLSTTTVTASSTRNSSHHNEQQSQSSNDLAKYIQEENKKNQVIIWSKSYCPYCQQTKKLFQSLSQNDNNLHVQIHELDQEPNGAAIQRTLLQMTNQRTVPNVFINNKHIGGNDNVQAAYRSGNLLKILKREESSERNIKENKEEEEHSLASNPLRSMIERENKNHQIVVWAKSWCPHCRASKDLLQITSQLKHMDVAVHDIDKLPNEEAIQKELLALTGQNTVPNIFVNGKHLGGNSDLQTDFRSGKLERLLQGKD